MSAIALQPVKVRHPKTRTGTAQRVSFVASFFLLVTVSFVGVACVPVLSFAQTRDEVEAEIEKTDRVIEKARELLDETGAPRGRGGLQAAERLQEQAKLAFATNNLRVALELTLAARDRVLGAVSGIRRSEENEAAVERELDRTDRILEEVAERLTGAALGLHRLEQAKSTQNRAWEMFRNRQLRAALKLTLEARDTAVRLGLRERFGPGARGRLGEHIERQLERLGNAIDRIGEDISPDNTEGAKALADAQAAYQDANDAYHNGNFVLAERHVRRTREALMRAVRTVEDDLGSEDVQALIDDARRRWENIGEDMAAAGNAELLAWHAQAGVDLDFAQNAVREGDLTRALVQTRAAMELMDRITDRLE